jgi:hypothetical protein
LVFDFLTLRRAHFFSPSVHSPSLPFAISIHAKFRTTRVKLKVTDVFVVASGSLTEWQCIGEQIDAAFIFARAHFVKRASNGRRSIQSLLTSSFITG